MWQECSEAFVNAELGKCEPLGLGLSDWATIIGLLLALLGALKFIILPLGRILGLVGPRKIRSFRGLKNALRPYVLENREVFMTFGPRSNADAESPEKFDLKAWQRARLTIGKNNSEILALIRENANHIPKRWQNAFTDWKNHIIAFQAHLDDSKVDYRNYQFQKEIDYLFK